MNMIEDQQELTVKYLKVSQPIGDFYICSIPASKLIEITYFDVRRVLLDQRDVERYLGVQRPLNPKRVKEIHEYAGTMDACFPTAVIIAIPGKCASIDEDSGELVISNYVDTEDEDEIVLYRNIARVLDGQHRLAGLEDFEGDFDINVSVFVDADIADQGNIFSTVNLAQTKVNKSLVYDLSDLAKSRSPQKTCHNIAVTLDREKGSPFYKTIKRLGIATPGREGETLTQATFIEPLLNMVSENPMRDRDTYLRKKIPLKISEQQLSKHPFQHMFVEEMDYEITDVLWNFFSAVRARWPIAWASRDKGIMLNRTNGYRALMKFLTYLFSERFVPGRVPTEDDFLAILRPIKLDNDDFNVESFPPGSSGESKLRRTLIDQYEANFGRQTKMRY